MSQWICEDVGLVLNEISDKLDAKIKHYAKLVKTDKAFSIKYSDVLKGLNIAKEVLEEVADNWTADKPPIEVLNKLKDKYNI